MTNVFKRELRANLRATIFWCIGIAAFAGIGFVKYSGVAGAGADINMIFDMLPRIVRIAFGMGTLPVYEPHGYFACLYVWLCFLAYTQSALLGGTILAKEERDKTADFIFTKPVTRTDVIFGKLLAGAVCTIAVTACAWAVLAGVFYVQVTDTALIGKMNLSMLGMALAQMMFFTVGIMFSALIRSHQKAGQAAAATVFCTYMISVAIDMTNRLELLRVLTPFQYFSAGRIIQNGIEMRYILLAAALCAAAVYITIRAFARRNIHT